MNLPPWSIQDEAKGNDLTQSLKKFFYNHSCPQRVHLVPFGSESLEGHLEMASKQFGSIEDRNAACKASL